MATLAHINERRATPQGARKRCFPAGFAANGSLRRCAPRPWNHHGLRHDALHRIKTNLDQLHSLPAGQLARAASAVQLRRFLRNAANASRGSDEVTGFAPVLDGFLVPHHPYDPTVSPNGAHVLRMTGSTLNEFTPALDHPEYETMTLAELEKKRSATGVSLRGAAVRIREHGPPPQHVRR